MTAGSHCRPSKGYLCLESEGGLLQVRDLRLMELPPGTHAAGPDRTAEEATATPMCPLYNGLDLQGWEVVKGNWKSEDWRLTSDATDSELRCTLPDLPEGEFRFDYKRPKLPDDGYLPFSIGGKQVPAEKEAVSEWNRVIVR